jgi:hypothetical protein
MEDYAAYWERVRSELRASRDGITAKWRAEDHSKKAAWLEQQLKDFDALNAVSESELAMLIRFAEWAAARA